MIKYQDQVMINSNLQKMSNSSTMATNELIKQLRLNGRDIIALGFGQSPFPPPAGLVKRLQQFAHKHEYLPVQGHVGLREEIAEYYSRRDNRSITADDVIIGPGTKELQFLLQMALRDPQVFVAVPSWVSYAAHCKILNRTIRPLYTRFRDEWRLGDSKLDIVRTTQGLRLLIINSPNNPNGMVYNETELEHIAGLLKDSNTDSNTDSNKLIILLDEIYSQLTYREPYISLAKYMPSQSIISSGISKSLGCGGWRLGYLVFPPELAQLRKTVVSLASETFSCASCPVQYACQGLFSEKEYQLYIHKSRKILEALTNYCCNIINERIRCHKPMGGWYIFVEFIPIESYLQSSHIYNSEQLRDRLLEDINVSTTPGTNFLQMTGDISLRICLVDFDGQEALDNCPLDKEITEKWIQYYCPRVIDGICRLNNWINNIINDRI